MGKHWSAPTMITGVIAAYQRSRGSRSGVFVEGEHPSVENRPRLVPVFPERVEEAQKRMTHDSTHPQAPNQERKYSQAHLTFLPFSDTFVLLRIPAFSRFCTWRWWKWSKSFRPDVQKVQLSEHKQGRRWMFTWAPHTHTNNEIFEHFWTKYGVWLNN